MLLGQPFLITDTKLVFVRESVTFSSKTACIYTYSLRLSVVGFHFHFLTVVTAWLCVNSYKLVQVTVD